MPSCTSDLLILTFGFDRTKAETHGPLLSLQKCFLGPLCLYNDITMWLITSIKSPILCVPQQQSCLLLLRGYPYPCLFHPSVPSFYPLLHLLPGLLLYSFCLYTQCHFSETKIKAFLCKHVLFCH